MSLEESFQGVAAFDEFPTNVARRKSVRSARNTPIGLKTQTTVRVSSPAPKKPARKDSAACVSLSSYHNVKEPFESAAKRRNSRTPDGSKSPIRSQRQPQSPEPAQVLLRFCPRIARSRIVPQEVGTTRAKGSFKQRPPPCQGADNRNGCPCIFPAM